MGIGVGAETRRMTQEEFGALAYEVMECVFGIHNRLGRFFDEKIYRDEIARRLPDVRTEVRVEVSFEGFAKTYFIDLLVDDGAVFELKKVAALNDKHRAQLLNYLLLAELPRGKLVNLRPPLVEHEFVNTTLARDDRTGFAVREEAWRDRDGSGTAVKEIVVAFLRDWGTCLDLHLYEEALTHFLGGDNAVVAEANVVTDGRRLGTQRVRLAGPATAFKITALRDRDRPHFQTHTRRFLQHTDLQSIHWINVTRTAVTFTTLTK